MPDVHIDAAPTRLEVIPIHPAEEAAIGPAAMQRAVDHVVREMDNRIVAALGIPTQQPTGHTTANEIVHVAIHSGGVWAGETFTVGASMLNHVVRRYETTAASIAAESFTWGTKKPLTAKQAKQKEKLLHVPMACKVVAGGWVRYDMGMASRMHEGARKTALTSCLDKWDKLIFSKVETIPGGKFRSLHCYVLKCTAGKFRFFHKTPNGRWATAQNAAHFSEFAPSKASAERTNLRVIKLIHQFALRHGVSIPPFMRAEWGEGRVAIEPGGCPYRGTASSSSLVTFLCYSAIREIAISQQHVPGLSTDVSGFFTNGTFQDAVKKAFGNRGDKTIKLVGQACCLKGNANRIATAFSLSYCTRGLIPIDHTHLLLKEVIDHSPALGLDKQQRKILRWFLDALPAQKRFNILMAAYGLNRRSSDLMDCARMWNTLRLKTPPIAIPSRFKGLADLHDQLALLTLKVECKDMAAFPIDPTLDGLKTVGAKGELVLVMPRNELDLKLWGKKMQNCIGGYDQFILREKNFIFGVKQGNELLYCISLRGGCFDQFKGKCNCEPNAIDAWVIQQLFLEHKLINQTRYRQPIDCHPVHAEEHELQLRPHVLEHVLLERELATLNPMTRRYDLTGRSQEAREHQTVRAMINLSPLPTSLAMILMHSFP